MTDPTTIGYDAEPQEVAAIVEQILSGATDADDRYHRATSMQTFYRAVADALAAERSMIVAKWKADGDTLQEIADRIGLSRGLAQKLEKRGRR